MEKSLRKSADNKYVFSNAKEKIYAIVVLGVPPITITLPLFLVLNAHLSPEKAALIPLAGAIIIAAATMFAV